MFVGKVKERLHIGFDDPADATGSDEEILTVFRRVRDEIKNNFFMFDPTIYSTRKRKFKMNIAL